MVRVRPGNRHRLLWIVGPIALLLPNAPLQGGEELDMEDV